MTASIEFITCADSAEWESWLAANHASVDEVWVRIAKKGAPEPSVTITETLDGALCYGWIDSHRRSLDAHHYLQRYSPRRARSPWSQVNVAKAEALIAAGRMRAAGFAAIEEAVADGRWAGAYERQRTAETPAELAAALAESPSAASAYAALNRSDRYRLFLPILKAATSQERATRVAQALAAL
ncbi:YdeI/OmpD-associated family protein [Nocardia rosealba]|uniref:YdeI/OmpD-associated family protein n=1 Tax=Nocardia rosealba TaxID=2878563 RepID=UPI001CD9C6AA|nr:YdeI/OmpD-associated family protein [Nocardia rosealba]MCA2209426.1 YdeI/OmpD-associated family protein [Nocardia rosealba]